MVTCLKRSQASERRKRDWGRRKAAGLPSLLFVIIMNMKGSNAECYGEQAEWLIDQLSDRVITELIEGRKR